MHLAGERLLLDPLGGAAWPAAGLLATETSGLGDLLMSLRDQGYALVVVEHHMDLVSRIADQVTCMDQGRLLARGTPQEVLSDERVIAAYLGKPLDEHGHAIDTPDSSEGDRS